MTNKKEKERTVLFCSSDRAKYNEIKNALKNYNCQCTLTSSTREAINFSLTSDIDLILLDMSFSEKEGLYVIESIRKFNKIIPIIVVTSKQSLELKIIAFETGCNDYLIKPYNVLELIARIRNQFRYLERMDSHIFVNGPLTIDFDAHNVKINGNAVHFTNFQFKLLVLLAKNIDRTLTHEYLIKSIWGIGGQDINGLRVFVAGIRKLIANYAPNVSIISTDVGAGYRMNSIK